MRDAAGNGAGGRQDRAVNSAGRVPGSTYRVQFNRFFTFTDARRLVLYFHDLGITDLYASPYLKARPESLHGYDICDHQALNPEIGTDGEYEAMVAELRRRGMGQLLDVVPNHMSIYEAGNARWSNVLENGPSSPHAAFFDIDWHPIRTDDSLENRVLLPILGSSYGEVLENQELRLSFEEGAFFIIYYEHRLPVEPKSYADLLGYAIERVHGVMEGHDERYQELQSIATALGYLPTYTDRSPEAVQERQREKEVIKRRLRDLCERCPASREALEEAVLAFNGVRGEPASFDRLDSLLERQPYRLADWRVASEEINYRRFFDINDLAAIRPEAPEVFEEIHRLVFGLLREGKVTGLRIDHPDGLRDPAGYFAHLQQRYLAEVAQADRQVAAIAGGSEPLAAEVGGWGPPSPHLSASNSQPLYVVAEKILGTGESLRPDWAVHGTTGYDFANSVNGLFVDQAGRKAMDAAFKAFTGLESGFDEVMKASKNTIVRSALASEANMLVYHLKRIASRNRRYRDFTLARLTFALDEVIACLRVYRTYTDCTGKVDPTDRVYIEAALREAKRRNPKAPPSVFDFLGDLLLLRWPEGMSEEDRAEAQEFVCKFQQTTGPVMAKAVEDTAFYAYNRLISLNDVGGDPDRFGTSPRTFHHQNEDRLDRWPHSLLATSTHDSKRSEDVRARLAVLSEIPQEWKAAVGRWNRLNRRKKAEVDGRTAPDRNEEYYLYQTLLGAWPLEIMRREEHADFVARIQIHMEKALREAKVNTSWMIPNTTYEEAVHQFVAAILDRSEDNPFPESFLPLQRKVAHFGIFNSLSQTLLKMASPGVPDFYQGTEIWNLSLVDPDNRRPVQYGPRVRMLADLKRRAARENLTDLARGLLETREDGRIKMWLIHRGLTFRREHPALFAEGSYVPLRATGTHRSRLCTFVRRKGPRAVVVVVPRLLVGLTGGKEIAPLGAQVWDDTHLVLPPGEGGSRYRNVLTGEIVEPVALNRRRSGLCLAEVFASFPVALLEVVPSGTGESREAQASP